MISAYVDRIEENLAVILLGENEDYQIEIPSNLLPEDLAEGSYINIEISIRICLSFIIGVNISKYCFDIYQE